MSSLTIAEKRTLEKHFGMGSGYVLAYSDRTFGELVSEAVGADIHGEPYTGNGTSKANKLRTFWKIEPDERVGKLIDALLNDDDSMQVPAEGGLALVAKCRVIAARLRSSGPQLSPLKEHARSMDTKHLSEQIQRMESAVSSDPPLAIGTAKELIETCCKTILSERGVIVTESMDVPQLTKSTLKALRLVPAAVPDEVRGADIIKRLLNNLATVGIGLAELRNLYGTGHGKHGKAGGLSPRHAKLAVGAASTLATFLFETHIETKT